MEALLNRPQDVALVREMPFRPQPNSIEDTGIDFSQLLDLALKTMRYGGRLSGGDVASRMALPYSVVQHLLNFLRREKFIEVVGSQGIVEQQHQYALTDKGYEKAGEALDRNQYVGPTPVPLSQYVDLVKEQAVRKATVTPAGVEGALSDLKLSPAMRRSIGAAVNGGHSLLLHGKPGNGKSSVAKRIVKMLGGAVLIPYAVDVGGQTIRVFDPRVHNAIVEPFAERRTPSAVPWDGPERRRDQRWALCERPVITVGGELTLEDLDLKYSPQTKFYLAPVQVLANCGVLVVDDFGRQKMRPDELLNRWIVPLEDGVDHYSLLSGETIEVPFEVLVVFSTNLKPEHLGDEAFWRRIRHKVEVADPDEETFLAILESVCQRAGIAYRPEGARYLIDSHYRPQRRPFRACQPRDLIGLMLDMGGYEGTRPELTPEWIDAACSSYFMVEEE